MTRTLSRDDFKVQRFIGRGATGNVYLAHDPAGRPVALKIPHPETQKDPSLQRRFAREVQLALGLSHPNLVKGFAGKAFGEDAFLALEYFPEGTLADRLKTQRPTREEAIAILRQVAAALLYLHRLGIVHQDVKPANVFLRGEVAKLGDFGVARTQEDGGTNERAGSPFYMAPELFAGKEATPAADAYSLGVMAYELLTGRRPFTGQSYEELLAAHLTQAPPRLKDKNPAIAEAVMGLLAKDPERRLSVEAFLKALNQPDPPPAPAEKPKEEKPKGFFARFKRRRR